MDEEGFISSDEEESLDFLLQDLVEGGDEGDDYTPVDQVNSSQESSQDSSLAGDNIARRTYWKDDLETDDGNPDPRTTPFRPKNPPGRQQQQLRTPIDFLKLFCIIELIQQICIATNSNARALISSGVCTSYSTDGAWEAVTVEELYGFIGIIIYMSVVKLSSVDKYWSSNSMYRNCPVGAVMTKRRFLAILSFLQVTAPAEVDKVNC